MTWWWRNCLKASIHSLRIVLSLTSDFVSRFHQIKISFLACAWLKNLEIEKPKHWQLMNQSCDTESVLYKNVCVSELLPNIRIWKPSFILTEFLKKNWSCTYVIASWFINFCFGSSVPRVILQFRDFKLYFNKCWKYGSCVTLVSMLKMMWIYLSQKPLSLSELLLLTIEPIDHQPYQPSSLSTIKPIDH